MNMEALSFLLFLCTLLNICNIPVKRLISRMLFAVLEVKNQYKKIDLLFLLLDLFQKNDLSFTGSLVA